MEDTDPKMVSDGKGTIGMVFAATTFGSADFNFALSFDQGRTWNITQIVQRINYGQLHDLTYSSKFGWIVAYTYREGVDWVAIHSSVDGTFFTNATSPLPNSTFGGFARGLVLGANSDGVLLSWLSGYFPNVFDNRTLVSNVVSSFTRDLVSFSFPIDLGIPDNGTFSKTMEFRDIRVVSLGGPNFVVCFQHVYTFEINYRFTHDNGVTWTGKANFPVSSPTFTDAYSSIAFDGSDALAIAWHFGDFSQNFQIAISCTSCFPSVLS